MDKGTYVLSMIEGERKEIREFVVEWMIKVAVNRFSINI
jgi:hypothetical protein